MIGPMTDGRAFDPYDVLGLDRDATPLQVARAHRRLAKRFHPDRHPGADPADAAAADRAMRRINEAWDVLSSPTRRADFDRRNPVAGVPRGAGAHWAASRQHVDLGRRAGAGGTWEAGVEGPGTYRSVRRAAAHPSGMMYGQAATGIFAARGRPQADELAGSRSFRDSPWAAVVVALVLVGFVLLAASLGSDYWAAQQGPRQLIDLHHPEE